MFRCPCGCLDRRSPARGCKHSHRSELCKVNPCHNQGGGGQIASQNSFTLTLEDLDFHVSVGGFRFNADSDWESLSCSPTLVTGDQQQWPSQPRGRAQPGDQPSPLGSNLMQICSTECKWFRRDAGPGLSARLFSASPGRVAPELQRPGPQCGRFRMPWRKGSERRGDLAGLSS